MKKRTLSTESADTVFLFAGIHFNSSDKRIENHSNRKSALKLRNGKTMKGGNSTLTNDHNVKISRFVTSENSYNGTRQKKNSSTKNQQQHGKLAKKD